MHKFDHALHNLICSTLRDVHILNMELAELQQYNYQLGVALHNIPDELRKHGELPITTYCEINKLDPTGTKATWGEWCIMFSKTIEQTLPERPTC